MQGEKIHKKLLMHYTLANTSQLKDVKSFRMQMHYCK